MNGRYGYRPVRSLSGLGAAPSASQIVAAGAPILPAASSAILGGIAASGGSVLGLTGAALTAAIPIVGAALAAATVVVQMLIANSGCGQTCIETSEWANKAAAALQQVLDGYFANPAPRTQTQQALAVANFNSIWQQLVAACSDPSTGDAGKRCISDRQAGACTWKQKYAPVYPGEPAIGECWNWFNGYLGPIQQDPVVSDPVTIDTTAVDEAGNTVGSALSSVASSVSGMSGSTLLLIGGGILLLALAGGDN
jgi:hypothetical protein